MKCIVENCSNEDHQGRFVGNMCTPCHEFATYVVDAYSGKGSYSTNYINLKELCYSQLFQSELYILRKKYAKYAVTLGKSFFLPVN